MVLVGPRTAGTGEEETMSRAAPISTAAVALAALLGLLPAPSHADPLLREKMPNDVGIELLGKSLAYSFFYQRTLNRQFALEAGLGVLGGSSGDGTSVILFLPVGARFYAIPRNGTFFVSGGAVFLNSSSSNGPFSDDSQSVRYGYVGPGFEFRAANSFLFRGTAYVLLSGDGYFIWPGLTVGASF